VYGWKNETHGAMVKEQTMPLKASLRTASSILEPSIWGPQGTYLRVS